MTKNKLSPKERKERIKELHALLSDELEENAGEEVEDKDVEVKEEKGEEIIVIRGNAVKGVLSALGIQDITEEENEDEDEDENEDEDGDEDEDENEDDETEEEVEEEVVEKKKPKLSGGKKSVKPVKDKQPAPSHRYFR